MATRLEVKFARVNSSRDTAMCAAGETGSAAGCLILGLGLFFLLMGSCAAITSIGDPPTRRLGGFVIAGVLFLIGLPLAILGGKQLGHAERGAERKCPHCAERILVEAKVCRFCGRDLPATGPIDPGPGI